MTKSVEHCYLACSDWMKARYGVALQRIPLDMECGCPRDSGRCVFCADGARAQQLGDAAGLHEQFQRARNFARQRYRATRFMVYFQAHTPLWQADEARWSAMEACITEPDVVAVSVGVRPDNLDAAALTRLRGWAEHRDVWVEVGVQTSHDRSLQRLQRGHTWADSADAIHRIHAAGLLVGVHLILGVPGESADDMCATARRIGELPVDGVKLHHLQVLKGAELAAQYRGSPFPVLGPSEYADRVIDTIRRLHRNTVILRVCADAPDERLLAPRWATDKGVFLVYLEQELAARGVSQGDLHPQGGLAVNSQESDTEFTLTDDGSLSFRSREFKEYGHAEIGARLEAVEKYVKPGKLSQRLRKGPVRALDVGLGLGANSREALECALSMTASRLAIDAVERDRALVAMAATRVQLRDSDALNWKVVLAQLAQGGRYQQGECSIAAYFMDARAFVRASQSCVYDLIFLDAFSPPRCPQLWTHEFLRMLARVLKPGGALLTYCAARAVRAGMLQVGLHVGNTPAVGRDQPGTIAVHDAALIESPLSDTESAALRVGSASVPYRDPDLIDGRRAIQRRRQTEVEARTD